MVKNLRLLKLSVLSLLLCFGQTMSGQPLVQAFLSEGNQETTKVQELSSLLNRLAEEKGSFFLYEPSLVEGVKVSRKIDFTQKTTTILNEVLPKAKLTYEQVDDHNFVIKKAALSSFQKTPLPEVLQRIEDEFGLKSELGDTSLLQREISGKISTQNKEMLFRALETLLDVRILNEGEKLKWMND